MPCGAAHPEDVQMQLLDFSFVLGQVLRFVVVCTLLFVVSHFRSLLLFVFTPYLPAPQSHLITQTWFPSIHVSFSFVINPCFVCIN